MAMTKKNMLTDLKVKGFSQTANFSINVSLSLSNELKSSCGTKVAF